MVSSVVIIGCGPAGLIAAQAAVNLGWRPLIYSRAVKSPIYGGVLLEQPIPAVECGEPATIQCKMDGPLKQYVQKVYPNETRDPKDRVDLGIEHTNEGGLFWSLPAWSIRTTYDSLWERFGPRVRNTEFTLDFLESAATLDMPIISSVPGKLLCQDRENHKFESSRVWAAGSWRGPAGLDNTILYNPQPFPAWYRSARIHGFATTEWPDGPRPLDAEDAVRIRKPAWTNCDCWPTVLRVGRYGAWNKDAFAHHSYAQTQQLLKEYADDASR